MRGQGALWGYFYKGAKQNTTHSRAHCLGCIEKQRPSNVAINIDENILNSAAEDWFQDALKAAEREGGSVLGVKGSMIGHLLKCPNVCSAARKLAQREKGLKCDDDDDAAIDGDTEGDAPAKKKRKLVTTVKKALTQTELRVFSGINVPFNAKQTAAVQNQFARATISANLPFRWVNDPEVVKLFLMFRATADDVIPDRRQVSGRLLDSLSVKVDKTIKDVLSGQYTTLSSDGWDDNARQKVTGVHLAAKGKTYLVKIVKTNDQGKDGESMRDAFMEMIDTAEVETGCIVILLCSDNDGGGKKGRNLVPRVRPWILVSPCTGHQFNLILGDYFKESTEAADIAEQATAVIGWIQNHTKVRVIFDQAQIAQTGIALAFILANLTRWTTHFLAFSRLIRLKPSLRQAVILKRQEIIKAQIGAEKSPGAIHKIKQSVNEHCDIVESSEFWKGLQAVVDDIEPICYGTNINQSDSVRPDDVLLTFAGIWQHFHGHRDRRLATAMKKRIEKRWKELDQPLFVFTLILNPFEGLTRFGDSAKVSPFTLSTKFLSFYRRVKSRPASNITNAEDDAAAAAHLRAKEAEVSAAFMSYLAGTGPFRDWRCHEETFKQLHGPDPIMVWEQFCIDEKTAELADFAVMLLELLVNQAGAERTFSDLAIKKTQHRNRLGLPKLEKMSKVGADIRREQRDAGLLEERKQRANHGANTDSLLPVHKHADILTALDDADDSDSDAERRPVLVRSRKDWRREMKRWIKEAQALSDDEPDSDGHEPGQGMDHGDGVAGGETSRARRHKSWLPATLETLFGGNGACRVDMEATRTRRRPAFTDEERRMELLQAEVSDEPPDDGALEGSGDDYM